MRYVALLTLALVSLAFAPAPFPKPTSNALDSKALQGTWIGADGHEARFEKDRLTYFRQGKMVTSYMMILNAVAKPKTYDLKGIGGGAVDGRTYHGIYNLDKDKLTLCAKGWGEPRPTEFVAAHGYHLTVYKRKKP
jgi:uncharacterized protein (TIGR03067 family)